MVGLSATPIKRLTIGVSIDYTLWSSTDTLTLDWTGLNIPEEASTVLSDEVTLYTGYEDVLTVMAGLEFERL